MKGLLIQAALVVAVLAVVNRVPQLRAVVGN